MTGLNEGLALKSTQVITIFVTIVLVSLLFWFLNKTKTGKSMKAYSDNEDLALLSGIDPKKNSNDHLDYCRNFGNHWRGFIWSR
jgi:branched-chain amino acid transport system permease protein